MRQIITRDELRSLIDAAPRLAAFAASGLKAFTPPGKPRSAFVALALAAATLSGATDVPRPGVALAPDRDGFSTHEIRPLVDPAAERSARLLDAVGSAFLTTSMRTQGLTDVDVDEPPADYEITQTVNVPRASAVGALPATAVRTRSVATADAPATDPSIPGRVLNAVLHAAGRTGLDPAFLLSVAFTESRMVSDARNPLSSASGPFQFTRVGWFEALYRFGSEHGLDRVASRISQEPSGAMVVDRNVRTRILALRDDPGPSAMMAAATMKHDSLAVEAVTGRRAGLADMYLLHLLGTAGAVHFVSAATSGRHVRSDTVDSAAVANNPALFVRDGRVLSASDAYVGIERMMKARWTVYDAMLSNHRPRMDPAIVEVAYVPTPR